MILTKFILILLRIQNLGQVKFLLTVKIIGLTLVEAGGLERGRIVRADRHPDRLTWNGLFVRIDELALVAPLLKLWRIAGVCLLLAEEVLFNRQVIRLVVLKMTAINNFGAVWVELLSICPCCLN